MNSKERSSKSLCENSMKVMVNIIKLSSFSLAKMSLGTAVPSSAAATTKNLTGSVTVASEPLLSQFPGRRSEKPQSSAKPVSFLMEPSKENESSYVIHKEKSIIDGLASEYIKKVHLKNSNYVSDTSTLSPYILPPPPRAVM